ncbi:hypothetical protein TESG_04626 [Trichophyton tonsurans CBS 112818]|uniref:HNH nuclease domain-containing protein n=1 Tax=Trichophyton tonsurans (strain CBS 112818) TaxID=647933 RepID=F2S0W3_TRIT1|nr:hypothetical protein TESG_04626 [Trichophyton tonsurans CBS 112818]
MPMPDRSGYRNVFLHIASTGDTFGGFYQAGSITEEVFLWMLQDVLLVAEQPLTVTHRASSRVITNTTNVVSLGITMSPLQVWPIQVTDEASALRVPSFSVSGRDSRFWAGVRARDGRCVVTGIINIYAQFGAWEGFEAAHVFPLQQENIWVEHGFGRWASNIENQVGGLSINSIQNGLLLKSDAHQFFDAYKISINPDDGYKVVCFGPDLLGVDGRVLDPIWDLTFEHDFPPGTDIMADIREGPSSQKRFEIELASRLQGFSREEEV